MLPILSTFLVLVCLLLGAVPAAAQQGVLVYVPNSGSDSVSVFRTNADGSLTAVTTIANFNGVANSDPSEVAVRRDQAFAYVTLNDENQVAVVNTATNSIVQVVPTGASPYGVAISPDGTRVYVANTGGDSVSIFNADPITGQLSSAGFIASVAGSEPRSLALSPDGSTLYVVNFSSGVGFGAVDSVDVVNTSTNTITTTITVGDLPAWVAVNPAGTRAYVTNFISDTVSVIDTATNTVLASPAVSNALGVTVSPDGAYFYATHQNSVLIEQFDAATNTLVRSTAFSGDVNARPTVLSFSPNGAAAYAGNTNSLIDEVRALSVASGTGALSGLDVEAGGDIGQNVGICGNGNSMLATGSTFVANSAGAFGCFGASAPTFTGGTLLINDAGLTFGSAMTLDNDRGTINTNGNAFTVSGAIGGLGLLEKAGAGVLTLAGANNYNGHTEVTGGTLMAGAANIFSPFRTLWVFSGATADLNNFSQTVGNLGVGSGDVKLGSATLTLGGVSSNIFTGVISGAGSLIKNGNGQQQLTGANTYTGGTTINGGTLAGTTTSLQGNIFNNALLVFFDFVDGTYAGAISGSGSLQKWNDGIVTFTGANSYTGATELIQGGLRAGAANVFGSLSATTVSAGTTLDLNNFNNTLGSLAGAGDVTLGSATLTSGGNNASTTFSGVISGGGGLIKTGNGTFTLTGANNYTGGTTISGGILSGTTTSLQGNIVNNANLTFDQAGNGTYAGVVSGSGSLTKWGTGIVTFTGANTYTGATTVNAGTLRAGAANVFGSLSLTTVSVGALDLNSFSQTLGSLAGAGDVTLGSAMLTTGGNNASSTFSGVISGVGGLIKTGSGILTLAGANTYTGGTTISGGALAGTTTGLQGNILNNANLVFDQAVNGTYAGVISGFGLLGKLGTGIVTFTGANSYTGATTVNAGTLRAGAANVFGSSSATTVAAGTLDLNSFNQTIGSLAGAGNVTLGSATLTAGGNNTSTTFSGAISGGGGLNKTGSGTFTLTGANNYTGGTTVAAGTLQIGTGAITTATLAGPVTVQNGARLGGTGTIFGNVTVNAGATLAPGASIGTLTTGNLNLTAGALLDFEFGAPGTSDRVIVNGNLTLDGTLNVIDTGGFGAGVYRLFDYTGLLTNNGLEFGTVPAGIVTSDLGIQTSVANQVNLLSETGSSLLFWDGAGNAGNGRIDGGSGTWTATGPGWTNASGTANGTFIANRVTIFQGAGGTVTVNNGAGNVSVGGMQFATDGYRIVGDAINLGQALTTIRVGDGSTLGAGMVAEIRSSLTGGGLFKTDFGTLILSGANTYSGGTVIDAGTLRLGSTTALGLGNHVTVAANGVLDLGGFSIGLPRIYGTGAVGLSGGRLTLGLGDMTSTFAGRLNGAGVFVKTGTGTLTLTGANSHTGDTRVERGTLTAGSLGAFGIHSGIDVSPGATLDLNHLTQTVGSLAGDGDVGLGSSTLITGTDGFHTWFGGRISGRGGILKTGPGRWTLAGNNDYTGSTVVAQGILRIAAGGAIDDSSSVTVLPGATLDLGGFTLTRGSIGGGGRVELGAAGMLTLGAGDESSLFSGTLTGAGALRKIGSGVLGLLGPQAHTGGTIVEAGALVGDSTSLQGDIANAGVVAFDQGSDGSYAGTMSGTGSLVKRGEGTLTLSGENSYTGGTLIETGTLVGSSQSLQGLVVANAALRFDQAFDGLFRGVLGGEGTFTKTGTGTLTLEGDHALTGLTTVAAGTLMVNGTIAGNVRVMDGASIGTQNQMGVVGDVTLNAGSSLRVSAGGEGFGLVSNGAIRIGGASVTLETDDAETPRRIQRPLVYAAGGLMGEAAITTGRANLEGYLTGDGRALFLTVLNNAVPLAASATSRNGSAVAAAIDRVRPSATGDQFTITRELAALADADLPRALDLISGEVHASALQVTALDSEAAADLIRGEMRRRRVPAESMTLRSAGPSFAPAPARWGGGRRWWGNYGAQRVSFASTPEFLGAAGYVGGFSLGLDWAPSPNWVVGAGGGYALGELMTDGLSNKVDTTAPRAMAYVGYGRGRWTAQAGTSVARTTYHTRRAVAFAARLDPEFGGQLLFDGVDRTALGDQTGADASMWIDLGFDAAIGGWTLQPGTGFRSARYGYDAWSETGAGALSLSAPAQQLRSAQADLTLRLSRVAGRLRPYGSVTYRRELGQGLTETRLQFGTDAAGAFRVQGQPFAPDRMIGAIGLISAHAGLSFGYRVDSGGGQLRHAVDFGVRFD